jgi:tRNA threonylcarbamoyladenosine modification (KEOPS) complex Cgi121 subunit
MADALDLMKKGAMVDKQERFRALLIKIDQLIENINVSTFRLRDDDLESIKDEHVLQAAQELRQVLREARKLQKELGG